jgi:hypothetical protein
LSRLSLQFSSRYGAEAAVGTDQFVTSIRRAAIFVAAKGEGGCVDRARPAAPAIIGAIRSPLGSFPGVLRVTDATDPVLTFRLAWSSPDAVAMERLAARLAACGVEVVHRGTFGIDARAPRSAIERCLGARVVISDGEASFAEVHLEAIVGQHAAPRAYFPRRPMSFR